ncbi:MAG: flagellar hook capping FlgD N-terminal domain-containing protein, partial [Gemmatimonadaceae bacterium]
MISAVSSYTYNPLFDTTSADSSTDPTKAADPTGPAAPSAPRTSTPLTDAMGKDDFMKLLVAQLKNQDPLNPMDGKDMAAQLAQFSSVEQLMTINKSITAQADTQTKVVDALDALQKAQVDQGDTLASLIQGQMAVSTVGKIGVTNGNTVYVERDGSGSITVDAGTLKGVGSIVVSDSSGNEVARGQVKDVKAGMQNINLDNFQFDPPLKGGQYTYKFQVAVADKAPVDVKTYTTGRITGLRYENGSPVLMVGDS